MTDAINRSIPMALALLLALFLGSCGGAGNLASPAEIPYPDLSGMEPQVRQQLEQARAALEALALDALASDEQRGAEFGRAGMQYHAYGLLDAARAAYANAARLQPLDTRWPFYLGLSARSANDLTAAAKHLEATLELDDKDLPARVALAEVLSELGQAERAEELFRQALDQETDCASAMVGLGKLAAARQDYAAAVSQFEAALKLQPSATEINYPLGLAYRGLGQVDKAQQYLERRGDGRAVLADPRLQALSAMAGGWRLYLNQATALHREGRYPEALAAFRQALELAPGESAIHTNMGSTLAQLDRLDEAQVAYQKALDLESENPMAEFNLATLLAKRGDDLLAVQHFARAVEIDERFASAHFNLANALRRLGRYDEAIEHYAAAVRDEPANEMARVAEALSLMRLERWDDALMRLEEGFQLLPSSREIRHCLIRILAASPSRSSRDGDRALTMARELVDEQQSLPYVVALAMAAAEAGDFALAVQWQQGAIDAVRSAGRSEMLPELERQMALYRQQKSCDRPWPADDPTLSPGRG